MNSIKAVPKFRLHTTLVIPFLLQIIAAVGLVGYFSFRNGNKAVEELANQLIKEKSARIERHVLDYFDKPQTLVKMTHAGIQSGNLELNNFDSLRSFFWHVVNREKLDNYLYLGTATGQFIGVERKDDGTVLYKVRNQNTIPNRQTYLLDDRGNPQKLIKSSEYDPRNRPWYKEGTTIKQSGWSPIFASFSRQNTSLEISPIRPIFGTDGQILGVISMNLRLVRIAKYLKKLEISPNGKSFIIERSGDLIASSTKVEPFIISENNNNRQIQRLPAIAAQDPIISGTSKFLKRQFGNFTTITKDSQLKMEIDNARYYIQVLPIRDGRGIDWLTVVVVPEQDFMTQIYKNTRNTILLCCLALLCAIVIGVITSDWLTDPILRISQASDQLAQGDLEQTVPSSAIVEINTLANSFNSMAVQLNNSFTNLEQKNENLRIAEENYRSIFENALEGIFQSSPEGYFINVNPALAKMYGYESPEEMLASITDISKQIYVDPEKRAEFKQLLFQEGILKNFEYRCYCKDGSIIWTEIDARIVQDNNGKILYYEGIVQDINDRKLREEELKRQLEELKVEIDREKREQEVAMLTQSNYFQEVQQEMAEVDLDEFWK